MKALFCFQGWCQRVDILFSMHDVPPDAELEKYLFAPHQMAASFRQSLMMVIPLKRQIATMQQHDFDMLPWSPQLTRDTFHAAVIDAFPSFHTLPTSCHCARYISEPWLRESCDERHQIKVSHYATYHHRQYHEGLRSSVPSLPGQPGAAPASKG